MRKFVLLLGLALVASLGMSFVQAQSEPTPTPQLTTLPSVIPTTGFLQRPTPTNPLQVTGAPFIVRTGAEMLFPAVVVLRVEINVPIDRVVSAQVHISQPETGLDVVADVEPIPSESVRVTDVGALISYGWRFTPEAAPPLFSTVQFDWTVRLVENVTARAFSEFVFADLRLYSSTNPIETWRTVGDTASALQLTAHNPSLGLDLVRTRNLRTLSKIQATTGQAPSSRFIIYDPGISFCGDFLADDGNIYVQAFTSQEFFVCQPEQALQLYQRDGYRVIERATLNLDQLVAQLDDIIIRESFARFWQAGQPPAWFSEGLFQLYRPITNLRALTVVREVERTNGLLDLPTLVVEPANLETIELWRAQSYLLTLYLADRFGAEAPFKLAAAIHDVYIFESALNSLFGVDSATLYAGWRRWILTDAADRAVRWTPYLETTATPTETLAPFPTRTPTSHIPTFTITPSATLTAPPFSTLTPVPPTPSNTPRPAGSLRSPTPEPTLAPEGTLITVARSPLAIIAIVAIIIIVLIGLITLATKVRK